MADFYATEIETADVFLGGRALVHKQQSNQRSALAWDVADGAADVEMLALVVLSGSPSGERIGVALRGSGSSGSESCYVAQWRSGTGFQLAEYDGGSFTELDTDSSLNPTGSARSFIRFRVNGTSLQAKIWLERDDEPAGWQVNDTRSALSSGWAGLFSFQGTELLKACEYLAVDTDGGTAPLPDETPGASQWATDFNDAPVGQLPSEFYVPWGTTDWLVINDGLTGGKVLDHRLTANGTTTLSWDEPGVAEDSEILFGVVLTEPFGAGRQLGRVRIDDGTWYGINYNDGDLELTRQIPGFSVIASTSFTWLAGVPYLVRLRVEGSTVSGKAWPEGADEPGSWQVSTTDTNLTGPGGVGIGTFNDGSRYAYHYAAAGMDGATAPLPGVTPGADQYATNFSEQDVGDDVTGWTVESAGNGTWTVGARSPRPFAPRDWGGSWADDDDRWWTYPAPRAGGASVLHFTEETGRHGIAWLEPESNADQEVVALMRVSPDVSGDRDYGGPAVRQQLTTQTGYQAWVRVDNGTTRLRVMRVVNGTATMLDDHVFTYTPRSWIFVRLRAEGETVRARVWDEGATEPTGWQIEELDSGGIATGFPGAGGFRAIEWNEYAYLGVGTDGLEAPLPGEDPEPPEDELVWLPVYVFTEDGWLPVFPREVFELYPPTGDY